MDPLLVQRVQGAVLTLVQEVLKTSTIELSDNLMAAGATSMTAMLLVGKLRPILEGSCKFIHNN